MFSNLKFGAIATIFAAILTMPYARAALVFSTNGPDGRIGTLSRPAGPGLLETETADDFLLSQAAIVSSATFVGLLPTGASAGSITQVEIEFYHVFPGDSTNPPSGNVPTRTNSPGDVDFKAFSLNAGDILITTSLLNPSFTVANTVVNGINKSPNQFTGGEGAATGGEVQINVTFNTPFLLGAGQYFFRPEVALTSGNFLWLSAPKPIVAPGTPFVPDLQSWIRNSTLSPDWLRIGTDITQQGPFNETFSLSGTLVPEPSTELLVGAGLCMVAVLRRKSKTTG